MVLCYLTPNRTPPSIYLKQGPDEESAILSNADTVSQRPASVNSEKNPGGLIRSPPRPQYPPCHPLCSTTWYHLPSSFPSCPWSWPSVLSIRVGGGGRPLVHPGSVAVLLSLLMPCRRWSFACLNGVYTSDT